MNNARSHHHRRRSRGLSAAEAATHEGLSYLVIEKGTIANTIRQYPVGRTMFSTPNEVEMHEGTLKPVREKPTREEMLSHYIHFVLDHDLRINTGEKVVDVDGNIQRRFRCQNGLELNTRLDVCCLQSARWSIRAI